VADNPKAQAADLIAAHTKDLAKDGRLGKVSRYLSGDHDLPYTPKNARGEFAAIARKSVTNWLPLISDTFSKGLFLDGYRPARAATNARPWAYWQANGLDARQTIVHRGALEYGMGWVLVLKGQTTETPVIRPLSPTRVRALYEDDDDEFPRVAVVRVGTSLDGGTLWDLYDETRVHHFVVSKDDPTPALRSSEEHGMGCVPLVRFRDRLDGEARGVIAPLFALQDRINEAVFSLMIALQYASFRQRWATGLAIPVDEDEFLADGSPNPNFGEAVEPFESAVNRLWVTDNHEAKFGDFAQTDVSGHLRTYESAVKTLAAIGQTPPHVLLGDLVNLSADALAAAEASTQRKIGEYETIFGEAWEQVFRLAAAAAGDTASAGDLSAQVRWRDTEARSLAGTVDALGKMVQMLMVPAEAVWERIPGVTDQDVERWREMAGRADGMAALAAALTRQTAPVEASLSTSAAPSNFGAATDV
jgi:hypothetical protein